MDFAAAQSGVNREYNIGDRVYIIGGRYHELEAEIVESSCISSGAHYRVRLLSGEIIGWWYAWYELETREAKSDDR
jgi:hypothetical protein